MHRRTAALALALVVAPLLWVAPAPAAAHGDGADSGRRGDKALTLAVIGDIPYGDAQIAAFPGWVDQLNADRSVQAVIHLGDIKNGSSVCSDEYFAFVKQQFDRFADPLIYTPGDNEWTDCHRPNNGGYNPLERLAAIRALFFPTPGTTLGQRPITVASQAEQGYPENVSLQRSKVAFAGVHIVGSNNSLAPWTGNTTPTPEQTAEVLGRTAAAIGLIRDTFRSATAHKDRAVVLFTQADMFDPTVAAPTYADFFAFQPIVAAIAQETAQFDGPVYLLNGDSHVYNADTPLGAGSPWPARYGVDPVDNLTRVTVEGSTGADGWLKIRVDKHDPAVLTIARVPFV